MDTGPFRIFFRILSRNRIFPVGAPGRFYRGRRQPALGAVTVPGATCGNRALRGGEEARTIFMSATASASVVGAKADVVSFSARQRGGEGWEKRVGMRVKPPFVWQETDPSAQCPAPLHAVPRPLAPLSAAPCGSPASRPCSRGSNTAPAARRPGAGGTEASVKVQRAGERNMALGSSMCKIRKELQ